MYLTRSITTLLASLVLVFTAWQCGTSTAADTPTKPNATLTVNPPVTQRLASYQTVTATPRTEATSISISGRTQPLEALQLVAEVAGRTQSTNKLLNEGVTYQRGETMILVDDNQYRLGLQAQRSQFHAALVRIMSQIQLDYPAAHPVWDAYLRTFNEEELLAELPNVEDEQLRFFLSANNVYATYYNIKSAEEMLPKYRITAPFSGVVTQGSVSAGTVVAPGTPLAQFSRTDVYELKASVSSAQIDLLKAGQKITLRHRNTDQNWQGTVHRIGQTIDATTQAVPVFIRLSGRGLRAGMFLEAALSTNSFTGVVALPVAALNRNNQVHVISDSTVILQDVEPVHYADNQVWVQGLRTGQVIITEVPIDPIVGTKAIAK